MKSLRQVIKVQVEDVDANSLLLAAKGDEFAGHFRTLLSSVTSMG
jgi:hypothetical protein